MGTESFGAIPFQGIILAHSNESEWQKFKNNKNNEAFIDRVSTVKVPYCLRVTEEAQIYSKLLENSELSEAPCAPETPKINIRFSVLSRVSVHENSTPSAKPSAHDGEEVENPDPKASKGQEYQGIAGVDGGMTGV